MQHGKNQVLAVVLIFLCLPILLMAQTTGKISGRVTDSNTGEVLPGVNVILEGTSSGAAADLNGDFFILNVPPGTYTVRAQMVGYETMRMENVRVSVNRTTEIKVRLRQTVLQGEVVVVQAEKVAIKKDQTSTVRNVSSDQIDLLPVENMGAVISMQAGVVDGHFRGGRLNEVSYLVDGMQVTEAFGGNGRAVDLETEAIQDLEVITGTFNAEYGRAMSGVVNAVTKSGSSRYSGSFSYDAGNYYTSHNDIFIGLKNSDVTRNQDWKFQLSGPIWTPFKNHNISFFINGRYQDNKNHLNGIRRFNVSDFSFFNDPDPANWISNHTGDGKYVPMNGSINESLMGKLNMDLSRRIKTSFLYTLNSDDWHSYDHAFKYDPDGMAYSTRLTNLYSWEINHMLSNRLFYETKLSYMDNYNGWYRYKATDDGRYVHDLLLANNDATGFYTGGQQKGHSERWMRDLNAKFDLTWQLNKHNSLKTGVLYTHHDLDNQYKEIRNLYWGTDLETQLYQPVTYPDSSVYSDIYRVKPIEWSGYLQDKIEYDEMVINIGVRYDYFNPETYYPSNRRNPDNSDPEASRQSVMLKTEPQTQVSPRLGLSYQLSNTALLHFSYGHFFQMPPMYALYQAHDMRVAPTDYETQMGNSTLKAEKTVQYEIGLWQEIIKGMGLEVALFYRDIYDLLSMKVVSTYDQIEYGLYSNKDYGNAKGLEVKYDFVMGRVSTFINYTLQYTRGNADNPTQTFTRAGDSMDPITRLIPMSWDQRHTLNVTVGYNTPGYGATMTAYYNSGTPYSWSPQLENRLSTINLFPNNAAMPAKYSIDMSAYYDLRLYKNFKARLTLNIYNLLDQLNEDWVNAETGRAYTSIVRATDLASHHSDFNDYYDRVKNPSMYSAPRLVKIGMGFNF